MSKKYTDQELIELIRELSAPMDPIPTDEIVSAPSFDEIHTVLFDVYGTLLISGTGDIGLTSKESDQKAMGDALIQSGIDADLVMAERASDAYREAIQESHEKSQQKGIEYPEVNILDVWDQVLNEVGVNTDIRFLSIAYESRINPTWPMPGAAEALDALKQQGFRLGIVSNAQFYTPLVLAAHFGKSIEEMGFDLDWCSWSYEQLEAKPSTALFHRGSKEVLYIGNDMLKDVWAAGQAGCRTTLFAGDRRSLNKREDDERCNNLLPDAVITDWRQVDFNP